MLGSETRTGTNRLSARDRGRALCDHRSRRQEKSDVPVFSAVRLKDGSAKTRSMAGKKGLRHARRDRVHRRRERRFDRILSDVSDPLRAFTPTRPLEPHSDCGSSV
jgi:hypothetical protein